MYSMMLLDNGCKGVTWDEIVVFFSWNLESDRWEKKIKYGNLDPGCNAKDTKKFVFGRFPLPWTVNIYIWIRSATKSNHRW